MFDISKDNLLKDFIKFPKKNNDEYILAFDPSWSEAETSDDFAIQVIKLLLEQMKNGWDVCYADYSGSMNQAFWKNIGSFDKYN